MIDKYSVHAFHLKDEGLTLMFSTVSIVSGHFKTAKTVRWTSCIGLLEYWVNKFALLSSTRSTTKQLVIDGSFWWTSIAHKTLKLKLKK